jgi:hypothetical protein
MSEHIRPPSGGRQPPEQTLGGLTPPAQREEHERTPGVSHESEAFAFGLVIKVGIGLAVSVAIVQVVLIGLLGALERHHTVPPERVSELTREDAAQPLNQRVGRVPAPHLEGIERQSSLLEIRSEDGVRQRFVTSVDVRVRIGKNEKARLFELREGQRVTISYYMPGGDGGGIGVVTSVTSPPVKAEQKKAGPEVPDASRTLNGEIIRIEPRSIAAARDWAEVQMEHYGWIDREKEIVHIPVEKAMEQVLRSKELGPTSRERRRLENAGDKR